MLYAMMKRLNISVLFVACLAMLVSEASSQQSGILYRGHDKRYANFIQHPRSFLDVNPMAIKKVVDALCCTLQCLQNTRCFSFNINVQPDSDGKYDCQLLATDGYNSSANLKSSEVFNHHSLSTPCELLPCQNGGTCLPIYETQEYKCICTAGYVGVDCQEPAKSCKNLLAAGITKDGIYTIYPDQEPAFEVYCDQSTDGGGWAVFQRRVSPFSTSFNRGWEEYRTGFGNLTGEFWLGNDNIHRLAASPVSFRIEFHEQSSGNKYAFKYENFVVAGADDKYRWNMNSYSGDLWNAIYATYWHPPHQQTGVQFSTPDSDNDRAPGKCTTTSGWWYNWCGYSNLNHPTAPKWHDGSARWASFSEMKVRLT